MAEGHGLCVHLTMSTTQKTRREYMFDTDTAVENVDDQVWAANLTDRWDRLGGGPLGGYSMAVALRALATHVAPDRDPVAIAAFFHRPARHGQVRIETETARASRRFATGEGRMLQGGAEIVRVVATLGDLSAEGRTLVLNEPPDLPPPDECLDPLEGLELPGVTITDRVEYRFEKLPGWRTGAPTGQPEAELWMRFKDDRPVDLLALPLLVDAAAPVVLEIGAAGSSTLEFGIHLRAHPAPGWLACRIVTRHVINGLHEEDVEVWDSQGTLVAQSRQLAILG
jgi:acyl-CoA thioesterase